MKKVETCFRHHSQVGQLRTHTERFVLLNLLFSFYFHPFLLNTFQGFLPVKVGYLRTPSPVPGHILICIDDRQTVIRVPLVEI